MTDAYWDIHTLSTGCNQCISTLLLKLLTHQNNILWTYEMTNKYIYIYMNIYTYKFATWKNKNLHNFCSYESMLKSNNVYHISFTSIKWTWHYISPLGTFLTWYYSLHFVAKLQWLWKTLNNQGEPQIVKFKEKSAVCRYIKNLLLTPSLWLVNLSPITKMEPCTMRESMSTKQCLW